MNISVVSRTTASTASSASASTGTSAAGDPFGFLAALQGELSARSDDTSLATETSDTAEATTTAPALPALLTIGLPEPEAATTAETAAVETPQLLFADPGAQPALAMDDTSPTDDSAAAVQVAPLLASLSDDLETLEAQLEAGEKPDSDLLDRIGETIDAIAALLPPPAPATTSATEPVAPTDDAISSVSTASTSSTGTTGSPPTPSATPAVLDEIKALVASIRVSTESDDATTGSTSTADDSTSVTKGASGQIVVIADGADAAAAADQISALIEKLKANRPSAEGSTSTTSSDTTAAATETGARATSQTTTTPAPQQVATVASLVAQSSTSTAKTQSAATSQSATATTADGTTPTDTSSDGTYLKLVAITDSDAAPDTDLKPRHEAKTDTKSDSISTVDPDGAAAQSVATADTADASALPASASTTTAITTAAARTLPAAYQAASQPVTMEQLAVEVVRQANKGDSHFTIRLDPAELGRVEVKLHVDSSGGVNAQLTVDRAETLDLFQRDKTTLERALAQAGLDTSKTNLEFSLRQDSFAQQQQQFNGQREQNSGGNPQTHATASVDEQAPAVAVYRGTIGQSGVNLVV